MVVVAVVEVVVVEYRSIKAQDYLCFVVVSRSRGDGKELVIVVKVSCRVRTSCCGDDRGSSS